MITAILTVLIVAPFLVAVILYIQPLPPVTPTSIFILITLVAVVIAIVAVIAMAVTAAVVALCVPPVKADIGVEIAAFSVAIAVASPLAPDTLIGTGFINTLTIATDAVAGVRRGLCPIITVTVEFMKDITVTVVKL
jgi:hypothetical protein